MIAQAEQLESHWGDNGTLRLLAHTTIGALTGGTAGAAGAAAGTLSAPVVANAQHEAGIEGPLADLITASASTAVGAGVGGASGATAAFNEVQNNFLTHAEASRRLKLKDEVLACSDDACRQDKQAEIVRLNRLDVWRDQQIEQACNSPASAACQSWTAAIQVASKSYQGQLGNFVDKAERASVQNQAFKYQQAVNNPFMNGVGKGLLRLTPPGLVVGAAGGVAMTVQAIAENGLSQTLIDSVNAIAGIPSDLKARLNNPDPTIRGEAMVDVISLGFGTAAVTATGTKVALTAVQKAQVAKAVAEAETEAYRIANNAYRDDSLADPTRAMSPMGGWVPAAQITGREADLMIAARLPEGAKVTAIDNANAINATVVGGNPSFKPPYVPDTKIVTVQTTQPESFVRVYVQEANKSSLAGSWMMRSDDIKGLSPEQIASKYALPQVPTHMAEVAVPPGQTMRVSVANDVQIRQGVGGNGGGGGVQFEVTSRPSIDGEFESWFKNPRALK